MHWVDPIFRKVIFGLCLVVAAPRATAQQPFVTDDADTTPQGHLHFEFSNEFDWVQTAAFPSLRQNTADFEIDYGLFDRIEIGLEAPLLTIFNASGSNPRTASGLGDTNLALKYNAVFRQRNDRSSWNKNPRHGVHGRRINKSGAWPGHLHTLAGGNYKLKNNFSFDFGIVGGTPPVRDPEFNWEYQSIANVGR